MASHDPTSVVHTSNGPAVRHWTVHEMEQLQGAAVARASSPREAADAAADPVTASQGVSGRYRATSGDTELELRVDVDGLRPTRRVSGDFFRRSGGTTAYTGSFVVTTPTLAIAEGQVVIEGEAVYTFPSGSPRLQVTIPLAGALMPRAPAAVRFLTTDGVPGAAYACDFESPYFRTLEFELDVVQGVEAFREYDVSAVPSAGPPRKLTVPTAFAEAGIEFVQVEPGPPLSLDEAGGDATWTNRELLTAMQDEFSRWGADAGWRVWLLAATRHEMGDRLRGIMFDADRRQGCAVFHSVIGGTDGRTVRAMLRTYVHELGHCFNLYHSHQKDLMSPPRPTRLDALSWMHYPAYYRSGTGSGEAAYWRAFPFQFDDDEIVHLRHGFRNAVIPGGQPFGRDAADLQPELLADRVADESGLRLILRAPEQFLLGAPVVVELKLELVDLRGRTVSTALHPNKSYVQLGISRIGTGWSRLYRPLVTECVEPELVHLDEHTRTIYDSAYIGYGKDGFYFGTPGEYELRAVYHAPDGSEVVSNRLRVRIKAPVSREDDEVADLFFGDAQGTLLYLLGSDDERLRRGNDAFALMQDKYPAHPMAAYASLVEGMNLARSFKHFQSPGDRRLITRPVDPKGCTVKLSSVVDAAVHAATGANGAATPPAVPRLDNVSLNMVMRQLARVQLEAEGRPAAEETLLQMWQFFVENQKVRPSVQDGLRRDIGSVVGAERADLLTKVGATPTSGARRSRSPTRRRP